MQITTIYDFTFDERLASLGTDAAGQRLRDLMGQTATRSGHHSDSSRRATI
ncbi:hypothetical protein [Pollutimonas subterranea]|uniref:hypothetical protein n=1 Tax=Pollutimonas subterranea TaxID=2045210 RepID=UPI001303F475|nr:hypothetical protein [Pollutimonas subterranea]